MAERIEEKYLLNYEEYLLIASRISQVMIPDKSGDKGRYSICSVYFDDIFDTALAEKLDGNAVHIKFRIRTYDGSKKLIRLERKTKRGTVTEKHSSKLTEEELDKILRGEAMDENSQCFGLVSELQTKGFRPKISVKYEREAYIMPALGVRVTFDKNIDALPGDKEALFGKGLGAIPALPRGTVILEIKYSDKCPSFIRKCCGNSGMQLSVSKYALCRQALI